MSGLKLIHRQFKITIRRLILKSISDTIMAEFYESSVENIIIELIGIASISDGHRLAENLIRYFTQSHLDYNVQTDFYIGRKFIDLNGQTIHLVNRFAIDDHQVLEINASHTTAHIMFRSDARQSKDDIQDLRGLVYAIVNVICTGTCCKGCNKLSADDVCRVCIDRFNTKPCLICNCHFGTTKNQVHKHCNREKKKKSGCF